MPEIDFELVVIALFFLSRFIFGGKKKKKKKPVVLDTPATEGQEATPAKKPNFIEQMVQQLEEAAKESDRKRREANGEFVPPDVSLEKELAERSAAKTTANENSRTKRGLPQVRKKRARTLGMEANKKSEAFRMESKASKKTELEKVFGTGFKKDQDFEDEPTYSEGRHFDTGHKFGHENDPVVELPAAYSLEKKKSNAVSIKETLAGLDLKRAMIINEVLGPPASKRPRQPHQR